MEIQCEFKTVAVAKVGCDYEIKYQCIAKDSLLKSPHVKSSKFVGQHVIGKSNINVDELIINKLNIENFPRGLGEIFPNLTALRIDHCQLKGICQRDLHGLEKLKELRIQYNNLTTLPGDLFTRMKNLQKISFRGNKLKYLNRKLLDPIIEKAQEIDLRENVVICYYGVESLFYTGKGSQELLFQSLQSNFTSPIEDGVQGKFLENLTEGLKQIWETRKYSDFTIVVEKKEFPVHKNILSAHSSVFTTIFDINMKEREQSKLIITDFSVGSVEEFLQYLYTGTIPDETNAMELFALSSKYDIPSFKAYWEEIMIRNIDETNAFEIFLLGHLHDSEMMKECAFREIKKITPGKILPNDLLKHPENLKEIVEAGLNRKRKIKEADDDFNETYEKCCKHLRK